MRLLTASAPPVLARRVATPLCCTTPVWPSMVATPPCTRTWNLSALILDLANLARMAASISLSDFLGAAVVLAGAALFSRWCAGAGLVWPKLKAASASPIAAKTRTSRISYSCPGTPMFSGICATVRDSQGFSGRMSHQILLQGKILGTEEFLLAGPAEALSPPSSGEALLSHHLHQRLRDRQPQTGAAVAPRSGVVGLPEGIEDHLPLVGGNADAGIGHGER